MGGVTATTPSVVTINVDGSGILHATPGHPSGSPEQAASSLAAALGPLVYATFDVVSARVTPLCESFLGAVVLRARTTARRTLVAAVHRASTESAALEGAVVEAACPAGDALSAGARRLLADDAIAGMAILDHDRPRIVTDERLAEIAAAAEPGILEARTERSRYLALVLANVRIAVSASSTDDAALRWLEAIDHAAKAGTGGTA